MNLESLQSHLAATYPNDDISVEFMVNRINANLGQISANYEKQFVDDAPFVEVVAWIIALFSNANKEIWKEVVRRYPNCCSDCLSKPCICDATGGIPRDVALIHRTKERHERARSIINSIERGKSGTALNKFPNIGEAPTLDHIVTMLADIYPVNDTIFKHNTTYFFQKLMKSSGRVSDACSRRQDDKRRELILEHSLSLLAWVLGFWRLLSRDISAFSPTGAFLERHGSGCPLCNRRPCQCEDNRFNRLMSFEVAAADSKTNDPREFFKNQLVLLNAELSALNVEQFSEEVVDKDKKSIIEEISKKRKLLEEIEGSAAAVGKVGKRLAAIAAWVVENWLS